MNEPAITVLMCSNVDNPWVSEAIESIVRQTFEDWELVFVANGVTDLEFESLSRRCVDPRIRIFRTEVAGLTHSLNLGLHFAKAPLVARMDSDDIAEPARLEQQIAFMRAHTEVAVCGAAHQLIDDRGRTVRIRIPVSTDRDIRRALRYRNPICHPTVMFRRDAIIRLGGYTGTGCAEDYELWCRVAEDRELQFFNMPQVLLGYRLTASGAARRSRRAYAHCSAAQLRAFLLNRHPAWVIGSLMSAVKAITRGTR